MGSIFELSIPPTEKLVLLAMADHARDDGTGCYPSISTLAKKTSLSRRGTQKLVARLKAAHLIDDTGKVSRFGTVEYSITLARGGEQGSLPFQPRGRTPGTKGGERRDAKGANLETRTCEPGSPESLRTKSLTGGDDDDRESAGTGRYNSRIEKFRDAILQKFQGRADEEFLNAALEIIDQRAWDRRTRIASVKFFETAIENFLQDPNECASLRASLQRKRKLRERFMPGFRPESYSDSRDSSHALQMLRAHRIQMAAQLRDAATGAQGVRDLCPALAEEWKRLAKEAENVEDIPDAESMLTELELFDESIDASLKKHLGERFTRTQLNLPRFCAVRSAAA
jgi:hypothetical protein